MQKMQTRLYRFLGSEGMTVPDGAGAPIDVLRILVGPTSADHTRSLQRSVFGQDITMLHRTCPEVQS